MTALLLILFLPTHEPLRDDVALIELNKYVHRDGSECLTQYIFWRWQPWDAQWGYRVAEWRMAKDIRSRPHRLNGRHVLSWYDQKTKAERVVVGLMFLETVSTYDPEVSDRDTLPICRRRGFR